MATVKCALCGRQFAYQGNAAFPLCRQCDSTLPTTTQHYEPEGPEDIVMGVNMGTDNEVIHGTSSYRGDLQQVAGPIWRVQSETSTKWYTVDLDIPKCDCTDWATKRNKLVSAARAAGKSDSSVKYACKHCRAAKEANSVANHDSDLAEKTKLREQTAKIKAQFAAKKTKADALKMLNELDDM